MSCIFISSLKTLRNGREKIRVREMTRNRAAETVRDFVRVLYQRGFYQWKIIPVARRVVSFRNPCIAYTPLAIASALMSEARAIGRRMEWNRMERRGECGGEHYKASLRT